ncbi:WD40 repeat-like protein [Patellaria atrata CBS 101060]|uniref:WD40 repeat-like protein n=1 Tax=Patellaria atrata CBS 101060 TaxID=1346257 RepID=A0A9P4SG59_9PEZI|nr:WD40 repeat-like protein [Patellaria atrata CBS 101060]
MQDQPLEGMSDTKAFWKLVRTLKVKGSGANRMLLTISPDSTLLAAVSEDSRVTVWDLATGTIINTLKSKQDYHSTVAFSFDNKFLALSGYRKNTHLWHLGTGSDIIATTKMKLEGFAFSPNDKLAAFIHDDCLELYDWAKCEEWTTLKGHSMGVTYVVFLPQDNLIAGGSLDNGEIKIWDSSTRIVRTILKEPLEHGRPPIWKVLFSPDWSSGILASIAWGDVRSCPSRKKWEFSPDGEQLVFISEDKVTTEAYNLRTGRSISLSSYLGSKDNYFVATFSANGKLLVTVSELGVVELWEKRESPIESHIESMSEDSSLTEREVKKILELCL